MCTTFSWITLRYRLWLVSAKNKSVRIHKHVSKIDTLLLRVRVWFSVSSIENYNTLQITEEKQKWVLTSMLSTTLKSLWWKAYLFWRVHPCCLIGQYWQNATQLTKQPILPFQLRMRAVTFALDSSTKTQSRLKLQDLIVVCACVYATCVPTVTFRMAWLNLLFMSEHDGNSDFCWTRMSTQKNKAMHALRWKQKVQTHVIYYPLPNFGILCDIFLW